VGNASTHFEGGGETPRLIGRDTSGRDKAHFCPNGSILIFFVIASRYDWLIDMNIYTPTNYVPVAGKGPAGDAKFKFLSLTPEQIHRFLSTTTGGSSRDLLVWMLLLNAGRVTQQKTLKFSRRWRIGVDIDRKTVYRCLQRLSSAGLVGVEFRRGKSPLVTLLDI
jgi:hypothetical protein